MTKKSPFANRTNWPLGTNQLTTSLDKLRAAKVSIFDLTESNPTRCGFNYPPQILLKPFDNLQNLSYDPSPRGSLKAREAIAQYYKQRNLDVSVENIFLTSSTSEGYSFLFRLLVNAGERVLFPKPSYPLFQFFVDLNDISLDYYSLIYGKKGWQIHIDSLRPFDYADIKAIVLVNPNNPTGSFVNDDELVILNEICQKHQVSLISDEVFADFVLDDTAATKSLVGNKDALTFVLGGLSKTLALPQMKLSWIIVQGPDELVKDAMNRLEVIADTYLSVNTPVQNAVSYWLENKDIIQSQIQRRIKENLEFLKKQSALAPRSQLLKVQGGWYAVLQLPEGIDEETWVVELLEKQHVFVHPGYFFDFDEQPFIVLSLLPAPDIFKEGIRRILEKTAKA